MASLTVKTRKIRRRKAAKAGRARKSALERNGTTPAFAIHKDAETKVDSPKQS